VELNLLGWLEEGLIVDPSGLLRHRGQECCREPVSLKSKSVEPMRGPERREELNLALKLR
jgi:hypothetical protein